MKLSISVDYTMSVDTVFALPDGKAWDDVKEWFVKWGTLYVTFDDGTKLELQTNEATYDNIDFKWPDRAKIRPVDAEGLTDYSLDVLDEVQS